MFSDKVLEVKVNAIKDTPGWPAPRCSLFFIPTSTLVPALSIVPKQALPTPISEKKLFGTPLDCGFGTPLDCGFGTPLDCGF